ncbi:MAG: dephospho-CoA kinase [Segetibacter sp.]|jgi:dephospho-CoA kinase|nr:dephospho-CoA kinase [Segetibacter sp.]
MLKIGLTGGIGSGKSVVAAIFSVLGIPVFDADKEAKKIMETDHELIASLKQEFGDHTYQNDKLNRVFLAGVVFNNPYKLEKLNSIVHPATINAAKKWMELQTAPYIVKEAALMFEAGSAANLDYVIGVHAPLNLRIHRVLKRDSTTREQVLARMSRQINDEIKMRLCDFVVENNDQQLLLPQLLKLHETFLKRN